MDGFLGHISGPGPHGMDPKTGPKPAPGRKIAQDPKKGASRHGPIVTIYTRVSNTWFFDRPENVDIWGLGGPGGLRNLSKRWPKTAPPEAGPFWATFWPQIPTVWTQKSVQKLPPEDFEALIRNTE